MVLKTDQQRVGDLLKETITLLCKNGLNYKSEFSVEALIGITMDKDDVFLVSIKETIRDGLYLAKKEVESAEPDTSASEYRDVAPERQSESRSRVAQPSHSHHRSQSHSSTPKRSFSSSEGRDNYGQSPRRDWRGGDSHPAKRPHTQTSLHREPSSSMQKGDDVIVVKEETLSDTELEQVELGGGFDMHGSEFGDLSYQGEPKVEGDDDGGHGGVESFAVPGCSNWGAGSQAIQMPGMGDMSGMSSAQGPSVPMGLYSHKLVPPPLPDKINVGRTILRAPGCFVLARVVQQRKKAFRSSEIINIMKALTQPRDSPDHIGEFRVLHGRTCGFYKCPPELIIGKTLANYGLDLATYTATFQLECKTESSQTSAMVNTFSPYRMRAFQGD